ncbi:MAG: alpha-amylase family protein [Bacteroidales bacterium]|nr:alpha-amylase family protein [Bacteroidales bacterium]
MKITIYQLLVRLFGNKKTGNVYSGNIEENGVGKMNDISDKALSELSKMGISHIWLTGILEHATTTTYPNIPPDPPEIVKGRAGSPYAVRDYYDVDPDLAVSVENRMQEFEDLIARIHRAGMKAWIDFVPNHVARHYHSDSAPEGVADFGAHDDPSVAFSPQNNFYYIPEKPLRLPDCLHPFGKQIPFDAHNISYHEFPAKATGNDCFSETPDVNDWYETVKLNYGGGYFPISDTWNKMVDILLFWCGKGVDGFRCDMAEMVPVEFWRYAIRQVKERFPETIFVAEIYNEALYRDYIFGGGFDFIYDKVGFYDTVRNIITSDVSTHAISDCWKRLQGLDAYMLRFLENHDEQRIASRFFAQNPRKAIPAMMLAATMNTGPVMLYFGQEVGENANGATGFSGDDGRTSIFDYCHVPQHQRWMNNDAFNGGALTDDDKALRAAYCEILQLCRSKEVITNGGFYDLMWANPHLSRQYCYLRHNENETLLFCLNFDSQPVEINVIIPQNAFDIINIKNRAETSGIKMALERYQAMVLEMI